MTSCFTWYECHMSCIHVAAGQNVTSKWESCHLGCPAHKQMPVLALILQ